MASISMKLLLEAGVHFGHQTNKWNPKMKPFIFGARNGIYIIDLQQTVVLFQTAYNFVVEMVAAGGELLFVGTKKQSQESIREESERCGMPYVNQRWLGGMITNFSTIKKGTPLLMNISIIKKLYLCIVHMEHIDHLASFVHFWQKNMILHVYIILYLWILNIIYYPNI